MVLNITPYGDNPWVPGEFAYSYTPDQLIAGDHNLVTQPIVIGAGILARGTVLGQQTAFTAAASPGPANVGNGTVGAITPGAGEEYGAPYTLVATAANTFAVSDPEKQPLGNATVGTPFNSPEIAFTISAGATPFAVGDSFAIAITSGTGTYIASVKTATDGSQVPSVILADAANASAGPVKGGAYVSGEFNAGRIIADASWSVAQLTTAMAAFGIHIKSSVTAVDPVELP